ncbi:MAG: hypothetical protein J5747_11050 [Spirochaetaceae bacterium]|nr:hypothetical protein [Spirochaetaceae bacterium]
MTLNSRNRLMKAISIISFSQLFVFAALFIYRIVSDNSLQFEFPTLSLGEINARTVLHAAFQPYSYASLAAIAILALYTPAVSTALRYVFEKTQSPEILYYMGFLTGCMVEIYRLCIPLFNLWGGYSDFLIFTGKLVLAGRILAGMSLLFSAIFSSDDKIQEADKNIVIAIAISVALATSTAVDTRTILPSIMVQTSYHSVLLFVRIFLAVMTAVAFMLAGKIKTMISYMLLFAGYMCLTLSDSIFLTALGLILFGIGTKVYLQQLHNYYLWK